MEDNFRPFIGLPIDYKKLEEYVDLTLNIKETNKG
jgi:hypothetical protein